MPRYPIIPYPTTLEKRIGFFRVDKLTILISDNFPIEKNKLNHMFHHILLTEKEKNIPIKIVETLNSDPHISLIRIKWDSIPGCESNESYSLDISENEIVIRTPTETGLFYAFQTLIQLVSIHKSDNKISIPCCKIIDWPAFPIRGFMHDVGRNFISIERLKRQMQIFARYKINVFHWHLTDNPAYRIESQAFPELNDPKNYRSTRDPGKFYTYQEIHDLIEFCKELHITIIPEIDVPGHSKYFRRAMKTRMNTRKGVDILRIIFTEFFEEFSVQEFPYIHIGSDEIFIRNPKKFADAITQLVHNADREVLMWNPGLDAPKYAILHNWGQFKGKNQRYIDSKIYYLNHMELFSGILRLFFSQPCSVSSFTESNGSALGSILCLWPDVNVNDESKTEKYNFLFPALITVAERIWKGKRGFLDFFNGMLPNKDSKELEAFVEYEERLIFHRNLLNSLFFFPYVKQSEIRWKIIRPLKKNFLPNQRDNSIRNSIDELERNKEKLAILEQRGATIALSFRNNDPSIFQGIRTGVAYAYTSIYSEKSTKITVWIGFETPIRSNREYKGIPKINEWDPNGGRIWLNDIELRPPLWQNPGKYNHHIVPSWHYPHHETPYCDEEFYWTRNLYELELQSGWNKLVIKLVKSYPRQNWTFTFIPVTKNGMEFKEIEGLDFSTKEINT